jgi:hypothetical protein
MSGGRGTIPAAEAIIPAGVPIPEDVQRVGEPVVFGELWAGREAIAIRIGPRRIGVKRCKQRPARPVSDRAKGSRSYKWESVRSHGGLWVWASSGWR